MRCIVAIFVVYITIKLSQCFECNKDIIFPKNGSFLDVNLYDKDTLENCVCQYNACAKKCCPFDQIFNQSMNRCVDGNVEFRPFMEEGVDSFNLNIFTGIMKCTRNEKIQEKKLVTYPTFKNYYLKSTGEVFIDFNNVDPRYAPSTTLGIDKYCMDNFVINGYPDPVVSVIFCHYQEDLSHIKVSLVCMLVSCFFILLTVAVYLWLPELRNIHGKVLVACLISFFVAFLNLSVMNIWKDITRDQCVGFTFIIYFALLAAFFWMNVMSYDVWCTFRKVRSVRSSNARFALYCAYSFGLPAVLTTVLAALEFGIDSDSIWLPNLYKGQCFLTYRSRQLYLYVPMALICLVNIIFFILTAIKLLQTDGAFNSKDSVRHAKNSDTKKRFLICVRLFMLMGVTWILEFVGSIAPQYDVIWIIFDVYNASFGLIIFIMFVCKKRFFQMFCRRIHGITRDATTTITSSTNASKEEVQMQPVKRSDVEKATPNDAEPTC